MSYRTSILLKATLVGHLILHSTIELKKRLNVALAYIK